MSVENGNTVEIEYTGTFDDGTVFDSSEKHGKPLEVTIGQHQIIPGFEKAIEGMNEGEEKDIVIKPEEAYGEIREDLVKKVPKEQLPAEAKEGSILGMQLPNGQQIPARVTKLEEKEATLDLNHPLAGKTLHFKIKLLAIKEAKETSLEDELEGKKTEKKE